MKQPRVWSVPLPPSALRPLVAGATGWGLVALIFLLWPYPARAQFGLGLAVIEAGLQAVQKALVHSVGTPLQQIGQVEKNWTRFEQTVIYPQMAITQVRSMVAGLANPMRQMNTVFSMNYTSAQLPASQRLEQQLLSRDPDQVATLGSSYDQVYGSLPANTQAPQNVLNWIDITDSEAQDGYKKAIELDALAQQEQRVAAQLQEQIQQAAPGSVPILEAEAASWVVRANAYTQSAMAELIRLRSAAITNQSTTLKEQTSADVNASQNLQQMLNAR